MEPHQNISDSWGPVKLDTKYLPSKPDQSSLNPSQSTGDEARILEDYSQNVMAIDIFPAVITMSCARTDS